MAIRNPAVDAERARIAHEPWPVRGAGLVVRYGPAAFVLALPLEFTALYLWQPLARWILLVLAGALGYLVITGRRQLSLPAAASAPVVLVYVAASLVSWLLTRAPGASSSVLDIALYPIAGLVIFNSLSSFEDHRRAWLALVASGVGIAVLGIVLAVTHTALWTPNTAVASRLNITFADPNITARFLVLVGAAALLLFAARQGARRLAIASAALCAFVLPLTLSRSGMGIFILVLGLCVAVARDRKQTMVLGGVMLAVFVLSTLGTEATRARAGYAGATLASIFGVPGPGPAGQAARPIIETDSRSYLIGAGWKMFTDHPFAGVGFGGYQHALLTTYHYFLPRGPIDSLSHTAVVTVIAEQGVIGAVIVLAFFAVLCWEVVRALRVRSEFNFWILLPAIVVVPIVLFAQFEGRLFGEPYFWLALALLYSAMALRRQQRLTAVRPPALRR